MVNDGFLTCLFAVHCMSPVSCHHASVSMWAPVSLQAVLRTKHQRGCGNEKSSTQVLVIQNRWCHLSASSPLLKKKGHSLSFFQKLKTTVCSFLRCLIYNAKIARVKNNRVGGGGGGESSPEGGGSSSIPVHVRGRTTNIMTRSTPGDILPRRLPTSVSGYSLCPTTSTSPPGATAGEVSDTNQETSHRYLKFYCLLQ